MNRELRVVGKPVHKQGDELRVTGKAEFSSDVRLKDMLHGSLLRSPYAAADIVSIDTSEAEAVPGVKLVMTHNNYPDWIPDNVSFVGHQVGCVIATSEEIAEYAKGLIKIEYRPKPFVLDAQEAMKPDSPEVFPNIPNRQPWSNYYYYSDKNEQGLFTKRESNSEFDGFGDIEEGFKEADIIVEEEGYSFALQHAPQPERRGWLANYDGERMTMWGCTQAPQQMRPYYSTFSGMPSTVKYRLISEFMSGGFGARDSDTGFWPDTPDMSFKGVGNDKSGVLAAKASIALLKPVRIFHSSNEESFLTYWGRGSFNVKVKMGFKKDGTLVAWDTEHWVNVGLRGSIGTLYFQNGTPLLLYSHNTPAFRLKKGVVHTNIPGTVGWCGYGNPEYMFATEQVLDIAAEKLGIDPVELRKKNCMMPGDNALSVSRAYGFTGPHWLASGDIPGLLDLLVEKTGWKDRKPHTEKTGTIRSGIGMALTGQMCASEGVGSISIIRLNIDGSAEVVNTYSDNGQGGRTSTGQIAAEALKISFDKVRVFAGDTDASVWGTSNACSGGTMKYGWATYNACQDALQKLFKLAAPLFGPTVKPEELDTENGEIFVKQDISGKAKSAKRIKWEHAFRNQGNNVGDEFQIIGTATYVQPAGARNEEKAATFVTLDVDTETGQLLNTKIYHCPDVGQALNPKDVYTQILRIRHGWEGVLGGTMILDKGTGKLLNGSYIDYPVSTMRDCRVLPDYIESGKNDITHPYGANGLGQALQNGIIAAVANAIYNAVGVRIKETPMTPDIILKALGKI